MIRDALFIARNDVKFLVRSRETVFLAFVMPVLFFWFIGTVTSGFGSSGGPRKRIVLDRGPGEDLLADRVARRLEEQRLEIVGAPQPEATSKVDLRLRLPEDFTGSVLAGHPVTARLEQREGGLGGNYDVVRVGRAIYTTLADLVAVREMGEAPSSESFARLDALPRALTLDVKPAGRRRHVPTGFEQAIPGTLVMFTLLVMTLSGAGLLVAERRQGLLRRLASTPVDRGAVVLGKWAGRMALGLIQIACGMAAGSLLFGMDWGNALGMVVIVMLSYSALTASLGLLVGSLVHTEGQAVAVASIASNVLAALGGCWWPIEITPSWMQTLAKALPTGWAMDALHRLVSFGASPLQALPHVLVMALVSVLLGWATARIFRFQ